MCDFGRCDRSMIKQNASVILCHDVLIMTNAIPSPGTWRDLTMTVRYYIVEYHPRRCRQVTCPRNIRTLHCHRPDTVQRASIATSLCNCAHKQIDFTRSCTAELEKRAELWHMTEAGSIQKWSLWVLHVRVLHVTKRSDTCLDEVCLGVNELKLNLAVKQGKNLAWVNDTVIQTMEVYMNLLVAFKDQTAHWTTSFTDLKNVVCHVKLVRLLAMLLPIDDW